MQLKTVIGRVCPMSNVASTLESIVTVASKSASGQVAESVKSCKSCNKYGTKDAGNCLRSPLDQESGPLALLTFSCLRVVRSYCDSIFEEKAGIFGPESNTCSSKASSISGSASQNWLQ